MEHTEADCLIGAATPHSVPISVDLRSMDADETEVRSGRWSRKAGLAFAAFAGLGALGVVATNAVHGGSAGSGLPDLAQHAEQSDSTERSEEETSLRDLSGLVSAPRGTGVVLSGLVPNQKERLPSHVVRIPNQKDRGEKSLPPIAPCCRTARRAAPGPAARCQQSLHALRSWPPLRGRRGPRRRRKPDRPFDSSGRSELPSRPHPCSANRQKWGRCEASQLRSDNPPLCAPWRSFLGRRARL